MSPLPLSPLPERPTVSVLVSCYNYADYVTEAVQSVLNQTYDPVETIVVEDGSIDGSREVLRTIAAAHPTVRLIEQANAGQAAAMNAAWEAAEGDIVCFLDADDAFEPDKCARVVEAFRAAPRAGFLAHTYTVVSGDGRPVRIARGLPAPGWIAPRVLAEGGAVTGVPPTSALALRRPVAEMLFPLPRSLRIAADGVIQRVAPLLTEVATVARPLMRYRVHGANHYAGLAGSAEGRERELDTQRTLYGHQHEYLARWHGTEVASRLAPLDADPNWRLMKAHHLILGGAAGADVRRALASVVAHPSNRSGRWAPVYRLAAALPPALARVVWRVAFSDGPHKRLLHALRRAPD